MKKITCLLFLLLMSTLNAQTNTYSFSVSNGTYQDLTNATSLNNGTVWDDPAYTIPIGFSFVVGNQNYTTVYLVGSGPGGILSFTSNDQGVSSLIAPIAQDIEDRGELNNSLSPISYKLTGQSGSHILKIEWKNVGFWDDGTYNDHLSFQVWLYENSNTIEYHYGPGSATNPDSFEGENGAITAFYPMVNFATDYMLMDGYFLSGDTSNPTVFTINNNNANSAAPLSLTGIPANGTIYAFGPNNLSLKDHKTMKMNIYPNPASDVLTIEVPKSIQSYQITILDAQGKRIMGFSNPDQNTINLSKLSAGIYLVEFETASTKETQKFVKL